MALVFGAGAATAIGASVVFFPRLVRMADRKTLAGALGFSAGVMVYVSFAEIILKSHAAFQDAGFSENKSQFYMTLCFFGGVGVMVVRRFGFGCVSLFSCATVEAEFLSLEFFVLL